MYTITQTFFNVLLILGIFAQGLCAATAPTIQGAGAFGYVAQWGLAGTIILVTLWRDYQREKHMQRVLNEHERYIRTELHTSLDATTAAVREMNQTAAKCHAARQARNG